MKNCIYCGKNLENIADKANHVRWCKSNPKRNFYIETLNKSRKKKIKKFKIEQGKERSCLHCKREFKNMHAFSCHMSHINGNHPGWNHINSDINRRSYPEKYFISVLKLEGLFKRYQIKEKFSVYPYFLDFAFLDKMVCLEIDGYQHYASQQAIDHDKKRDEILISKGWRVYRINWSSYQKAESRHLEFEKFLNFLDSSDNYSSYNYLESIKKTKRTRKEYINQKMIERRKYNKENYQYLISNFDFNSKGWIKKMSILLKISEQKVKPWLRRYFPELGL